MMCTDPDKTRMPMDMTAVTNLFGQDLDIMFKNGPPDSTRFTRCWKSMSKKLEGVAGQEGLPPMTLADLQRWAASNPPAPAPPPPPPPGQQVDIDALLGEPQPVSLAPPDLNVPAPPPDPPLPSDPLFSLPPPDPPAPPPAVPPTVSMQIPAAPPIPGDGTVSGPPTGFTPPALNPPTAPMPIHQVPPTMTASTIDPDKRARRKRYALIAVTILAALALVFGITVLIAKNSNSITTAFKELTKPKPQPAPTAQPAPVQTAQPVPVAPAEPPKVISAKCDYLTDGVRLAPCEWIKGPGPFQCDIGSQDGTGFAKCGEFIYRSDPLPTWGGKGITVEFRR
ncbi:hypothetical protein IT413_02655 [Candidatus Peregrinibacteria bacterium]|nr:hypothetical protein [Candidatus Peregrinibacteria bacterium]